MSALKVHLDGLSNNPHCLHGPTLLFSRQVKGKEQKFYACSAYRDRKDCPFFLRADEKLIKSSNLKKKHSRVLCNINHKQIYSNFLAFKNLPLKDRKFCHSCFTFILPENRLSHSSKCVIVQNVSDSLLTHPTALIKPIKSSKKEAQFWFTECSKKFIIDSLKSISATSCICIGAPTIHELLRQTNINSVLFDIDKRYHYFYSEDEFCWFNMFNCYFISNSEYCQQVLKKYLSGSVVAVVIDPPFGARIEPLANTVNLLQKQSAFHLNILLVLPYFMENNVLKSFPNFTMLDYQVQYSNHNKFQNYAETNKKPSVVRIFTNISPKLLKMSEAEGYYYCPDCCCWRYRNNKHCIFCKTCPSKNGDLYKHCSKCSKCVKQTWIHCPKCNRCCIPSHNCNFQNEGINTLKRGKKNSRDTSHLSKGVINKKKRKDFLA
ncbi:rRNA N(6)-adenosine-methyltransferase ZCCHC4-like [Rhodnius prolixus]|uniref:rRNA N(6)-adenosine-methyltransferase ZCCHC4-like n=1 Tax=Rhodnius prolixus TaxID=13249 RepID=UPI003D18FC5E